MGTELRVSQGTTLEKESMLDCLANTHTGGSCYSMGVTSRVALLQTSAELLARPPVPPPTPSCPSIGTQTLLETISQV